MKYEIKALEGIDHSVEEIEVLQWYKKPGDAVRKDEAIVYLDVQKTTLDYLSPVDGIIIECCFDEKERAPRGATLCIIETDSEGAQITLKDTAPESVKTETASKIETEKVIYKKEEMIEKEKEAQKMPTGGDISITKKPVSEENVSHITPLARIAGKGLGVHPCKCVSSYVRLADIEHAAENQGKDLQECQSRISIAVGITDKARRLLEKYGLSEKGVFATGFEGIITADDVMRAARDKTMLLTAPSETAPDAEKKILPQNAIPLRMAWNVKAGALTKSISEIPHAEAKMKIALVWVFDAYRSYNDRVQNAEQQIALLHIVAYAVSYLLKDPRFSYFNHHIEHDGTRYYEIPCSDIGLGISIAREYDKGGLIVSVIRNAGDLSLVELAREINARVRRKERPPLDDFHGLTFTINNTGIPFSRHACVADGRYKPRNDTFPHGDFTGRSIIPWAYEGHATSAILSIGTADMTDEKRHAVFSLTFDHRLIDGMHSSGGRLGAIEFLAALKVLLESEEFLSDIFDGKI